MSKPWRFSERDKVIVHAALESYAGDVSNDLAYAEGQRWEDEAEELADILDRLRTLIQRTAPDD